MYKITCSRAVNKPRVLKEVWQCTKYDNLIFNFMNFNENLKIGERKGEKIKQVNLQNDLYLGN